MELASRQDREYLGREASGFQGYCHQKIDFAAFKTGRSGIFRQHAQFRAIVSPSNRNRKWTAFQGYLPRMAGGSFARSVCVWRILLIVCLPLTLMAVTLEELLTAEKMTPKKFATYFKDFEYKFYSDIQSPKEFLATKSGDCDDYATLADTVLRKHGFTTRLISVRMPGLLTHVVCYVAEEKVYLDFNNRVYLSRTEKSDPDLRAIAQKVARSFEANWTSVSEFTYRDGVKELVQTISKTDAFAGKEEDKKPATPDKKKIIIDF